MTAHQRFTGTVGVLLLCVLCVCAQSRFYDWLRANKNQACPPAMPLSYMVYPANYFSTVPADQRVSPAQRATQPQTVPQCGNRVVQPQQLDDFTFQTEKLIVTNGLNLYDASTWMMAMSLLGDKDMSFFNQILIGAKTCQWQSILADAACKGIVVTGNCSGNCGFCYGDGPDKTLTGPQAWYFKTISALYSVPTEPDARCPDFGQPWTWNDWMPICGENAWIHLIGPLQAGYLASSNGVAGISATYIDYAVRFLISLQKMVIPEIGAIYYAPHNTYNTDYKQGSEISTENQVSTMAGLLMLRQVLVAQNVHMGQIQVIDNLVANIKMYLMSAFNTQTFYFRNGGGWDFTKKVMNWYTDFAVDCQTWTMTLLGYDRVNSWFGSGTAQGIWDTTKKIGGYKFNGTVTGGLGFSFNQQAQVLSGEWTLGGVNMLMQWANQTKNPDLAGMWSAEAKNMRETVDREITSTFVFNGNQYTAVKYANQRYYIPFGWWSNPLPSLASTSWAVMVDKNFNPFYLGGAYHTYDF